MRHAAISALALAATAGSQGCGEPGEGHPDAQDIASRWVLNRVYVGDRAEEVLENALDLDGDPLERRDNALGLAMMGLSAQLGSGIQASMDAAVRRGDVMYLLQLQTGSMVADRDVSLWLLAGADPMPAPCSGPDDDECGRHLDGAASFEVDTAASSASPLTGRLVEGGAIVGPGSIALELQLLSGTEPQLVPLVGARVEIDDVSATVLAGTIGGAVHRDAIDEVVAPAMSEALSGVIARDCTGTSPPCCERLSPGSSIIGLFDADEDCVVTAADVQSSEVLSSLLEPDLDLFDADGNFNPGSDGVTESLSWGMSFTAGPASFPAP